MECHNCKVSSPLEQYFIETKKGIRLCPSCNYQRNDKAGWFTVAWVALFLIIGHTMFAMGADLFIQNYLLAAAWGMIFLYVSIAVHEYGHFFICRILGGVCPLVNVGEGRIFYRIKTKTSLWQFATNPSLGLAYAVFPENKSEVWREVSMLLGGILMNVVLVLIGTYIFFYGSDLPLIGQWHPLFLMLIVVNFLLIFGSLFGSLKKRGLESDGHAVYRLLRYGRETDFYRNKKLAYEFTISYALSTRGDYQELSELIVARDDYKESTLSLITLSACYAYTYRSAEFLTTAHDAMSLYENNNESLIEGFPEEVVSALVKNNLAFALYCTGSSDKDRVMKLAQSAYALMPWEHSFKGTYGAALIHTDSDIKSGVTLLETIISNPINASDKTISINYYCLAKGYLKLGEIEKFENAIKNAIDLNPNVERYFQVV